MSFEREDDTRLRMEEWERWGGDGVDMVRSSASIWGRLVREVNRGDVKPLPTIGVEAGFTDEARKRMHPDQWMALVVYYLWSGGGVRGAASWFRIGKSAMHARLVTAHSAFWEQRGLVEAEAEARRKAYAATVRGEAQPEYALAGFQDRSARLPGQVEVVVLKEKKTCFSTPDSCV